MIIEVKNRLHSLKYSLDPKDEYLLEYIYNKNLNEIVNEMGLTEVSETPMNVIIDRSCGEYLKNKYLEGSLEQKYDEKEVLSISEGDIKIVYSENKPKIEQLIDYLINQDFDFSPYRSVTW